HYLSDKIRYLSTHNFMAPFYSVQCRVRYRIVVVWTARDHSDNTAGLMGGCVHLCLPTPGSHAATHGILDSDSASAHRIRSPLTRRTMSLPSAVRMGNDLRQGRS